MLALQKLGERLTQEGPKVLARMPLSDEMLAALDETQRIKSRNAMRRHHRRLGKLMRHEEIEEIQQVIDEVDNKHNAGVAKFHALERWRDRLIEGESEDFGAFLSEFPQADRQQLRQLIQAVQREREKEQPPTAYRKLFKYLREVAGF